MRDLESRFREGIGPRSPHQEVLTADRDNPVKEKKVPHADILQVWSRAITLEVRPSFSFAAEEAKKKSPIAVQSPASLVDKRFTAQLYD